MKTLMICHSKYCDSDYDYYRIKTEEASHDIEEIS